MRLKILLLSHRFFPDIGGIETVSEILAGHFSKAGHFVHLLTWSAGPNGKQFPFVVYRRPNKKRLIREHGWADLVFENNPCLRLSWPGIFFGRPTVVGLHTWIASTNSGKVQASLKKIWLKRAKVVISCSEAIRSRCWPASTVIENPYQDNIFKMIPGIPRTLDFIFLGRLVSDKGIREAILAFQQLLLLCREKGIETQEFSFSIVGDGPDRQSLERLVVQLELGKHIVFTGTLRDEVLVRCLNRHRFLLVPSKWEEPFGIVALEGMACGCIPIVSDGGGLPNAVGKAGLVFQRGNINELVMHMYQLLTNPELAHLLQLAAPAQLQAHYASEVSSKYLSIIENVIKGN